MLFFLQAYFWPNRCSFLVGLFFNEADLAFLILSHAALSLFFADLGSELFYIDKTMMVFGDTKEVAEDMVKVVE